MSIVDAIEKVKRMKTAAAATQARSAAPQPFSDRNSQSTVVDTAPVLPVEPVERVELPQLDLDVVTCTANRVIVPGVEVRLGQLGSPSFRILRTRLLQQCRTNNWTSLCLTSAGPGEGKTVTSLNLAINIAHAGNHDVFLLDLDMRNPSVCKYLGVTPPADIVDYFKGQVQPSEILFKTSVANLTLAGSSSTANNASELLATDRLRSLIEYIHRISSRPLIVMDLPPVVNTDDALVVAPRVDAILLVVSEGVTRRDSLERAVGLLSEFPMAGIVLNQCFESLGADYYGS
jgi:capsular exopolysaccharide synthesis family protein